MSSPRGLHAGPLRVDLRPKFRLSLDEARLAGLVDIEVQVRLVGEDVRGASLEDAAAVGHEAFVGFRIDEPKPGTRYEAARGDLGPALVLTRTGDAGTPDLCFARFLFAADAEDRAGEPHGRRPSTGLSSRSTASGSIRSGPVSPTRRASSWPSQTRRYTEVGEHRSTRATSVTVSNRLEGAAVPIARQSYQETSDV